MDCGMFGDPLVRPRGSPARRRRKTHSEAASFSWVCLATAIFFFVEFLLKLDDPFYRRHPENFFVLWSFIGFGVLSFVWMRFAHVTVSRGMVIELTPPFWRKEI